MGYWLCPRCGSNDTYQGTEVVSEYKKGKSVGFENEFGATISQNIGGETTHKQMTVTKCRACDTLLGEKDYILTSEEIQQRAIAQREAEERDREKSKNFWKTAKHFVTYIIVVGIGFGIGGLISYLVQLKFGFVLADDPGQESWPDEIYYFSCFVGEVVAAIPFVLYMCRGKDISRTRIVYVILLFIEFGIIVASIES